MNETRIMGIDYGKVRIGIAMSDPLKMISSPFATYKTSSTEKDLEFFCKLITEYNVETIVFGLPYNMDGTEGKSAEMVKSFAALLKQKCNVNIVFEDERLTSVEAEEILLSANVKREKRKELIDKVAAQLILQQYLKRRF